MIIEDTGIGMSKEFQQHLFDPFTREHEEMAGKYEGTGLGLSIVKHLVEKMGGDIQVESETDQGSCFTVEIPFRMASQEDVAEAAATEEPCSIEGRNILLVEDNELNMEIAEFLLQDRHANVTKAWNGKEAVCTFENSQPGAFDVILMDIMMPVMDGYQAAESIRALDREDAGTIPIIAMTANAFTEDKVRARNAGMNDHISKPIAGEKLYRMLSGYVKREAEKRNV